MSLFLNKQNVKKKFVHQQRPCQNYQNSYFNGKYLLVLVMFNTTINEQKY